MIFSKELFFSDTTANKCFNSRLVLFCLILGINGCSVNSRKGMINSDCSSVINENNIINLNDKIEEPCKKRMRLNSECHKKVPCIKLDKVSVKRISKKQSSVNMNCLHSNFMYECYDDLVIDSIYEIYTKDTARLDLGNNKLLLEKFFGANIINKLLFKRLIFSKGKLSFKRGGIHSIIASYLGTFFSLACMKEFFDDFDYYDIISTLGYVPAKSKMIAKIENFLKFNNRFVMLPNGLRTDLKSIVEDIKDDKDLDKNFGYLLKFGDLDIVYFILCIINRIKVKDKEFGDLLYPIDICLDLNINYLPRSRKIVDGLNIIGECSNKDCFNFIIYKNIGFDYGFDDFDRKNNCFDIAKIRSNMYCQECKSKIRNIKRIALSNCRYRMVIDLQGSRVFKEKGYTLFVKFFDIDFKFECWQLVLGNY